MASRATEVAAIFPLPLIISAGLYKEKMVRFLIQSILSLSLPNRPRLKNPNAMNPEMPSALFSSLEREDTRNEIPPTAKKSDISEEVSIENVMALMQLYMNQYETVLEMAQKSGDIDRFINGMVHMFLYGVCGKP